MRRARATREEVRHALRRGRTTSSSLFVLKTAPQLASDGYPGPKGAFVVSKKVSKLATRRNLLKRRARAIFDRNADSLDARTVYVFLLRQAALYSTFSALEKEMNSALGRAHTRR